MNKHFQDARYYLKRTGETTKAGIAEELEPLGTTVRGFGFRRSDPETEPRRFERVRTELAAVGVKTRTAIRTGREKVLARRDRTAA